MQSVIGLPVAFFDISVQLRRSAGISPGRVERPRTAMSQNVVNVVTNHTDDEGFVAHHVDFNSLLKSAFVFLVFMRMYTLELK